MGEIIERERFDVSAWISPAMKRAAKAHHDRPHLEIPWHSGIIAIYPKRALVRLIPDYPRVPK